VYTISVGEPEGTQVARCVSVQQRHDVIRSIDLRSFTIDPSASVNNKDPGSRKYRTVARNHGVCEELLTG
jgi:hypothetical protein